jgi:hypothetical protein
LFLFLVAQTEKPQFKLVLVGDGGTGNELSNRKEKKKKKRKIRFFLPFFSCSSTASLRALLLCVCSCGARVRVCARVRGAGRRIGVADGKKIMMTEQKNIFFQKLAVIFATFFFFSFLFLPLTPVCAVQARRRL